MLKDSHAFSGFSVVNQAEAEDFYKNKIGLDVTASEMGLMLRLAGGGRVFMYPKENHIPASFTVLNFSVDNIDKAVDELVAKGIKFEVYEGMHQDNKRIARGIAAKMGPDIAWFKDTSGNILSVLQEPK